MKISFIGFSFILLPSFLLATSFRPLSDREKFESAEFICAGKVLKLDSLSTEKRVSTYATVEIIDCAKGQIPQSPIQVQWPGGSHGKSRTLIPGVVYLQPQEIGVLYLHYNSQRKIYQLQAWQVDKLRQNQTNAGTELLFEYEGNVRSRSKRNQQEVKTWTSFKRKVQEELTVPK